MPAPYKLQRAFCRELALPVPYRQMTPKQTPEGLQKVLIKLLQKFGPRQGRRRQHVNRGETFKASPLNLYLSMLVLNSIKAVRLVSGDGAWDCVNFTQRSVPGF